MDSISRLHLCSHLLRQTLQSLCNDSEWIYATFWRIIPRHFPPPKWELGGYLDRSKANKRNWILVWEDGYCDFARSVIVIDHDEQQAVAPPASGSPALAAAPDIIMEKTVHSGMHPELFFKMSHEVYNYGEGLMGKVAADNGHKWIYKDPPERDNRLVAFWHNTIDPQPRTWEVQFKAGVQTIAVVSVREGLVQLASMQQVLEDVNFVAMVQRTFNSALQQTMMSPSLLLQQPTAAYTFPVLNDPCNIATTANTNTVPTTQYHHHQWGTGVNMIAGGGGGGGNCLYNNATLTSPDSLVDRKLLVRHHDEIVRDNQDDDDDEEPPFRRTLERRLSWNETVSDSRRRSALSSLRNATMSSSAVPIISPSPTARLLAEAQLGLSENSLLAWYNPTTQPAPSISSPFSTTKPEETTIAPTSTAAAASNVITTSCLKIDLPTTSSSSLSSPSSSSSSSASNSLSASVLPSMSSLQAPLSRLPAVTKAFANSPSPTTSAVATAANCSAVSCKTVHTSSFPTSSQNGHVLRERTPNIILKGSSLLDHCSPLMRTLSAPATAGCRSSSNCHLFTNCHPIPASSLSGNLVVYPCRTGCSRTAAVEPTANSAYTKAANTSMLQDISKTKPSVSTSTIGIEIESSSILGPAVPNSASAAVGTPMVNVKENDLAFIQPKREDHTQVITSTGPSLVLTAPIGSDNNHDVGINANGEVDGDHDVEEAQRKDGSNIVQQRCQVVAHIISDHTVTVSDSINNTTAGFTDLALHTYLQDIESEEAAADDCKQGSLG